MKTKTTRKFKGSLFLLAIVAAVTVGEIIAWKLSSAYGVRISPIVAGGIGIGTVLLITSVLFEDADLG